MEASYGCRRYGGADVTAELGRFGVWAGRGKLTPGLAVEVEALGYGAVWIGGSSGDLILAESLLAATQRLTVVTGIVNIWTDDAVTTAASYHRVVGKFAGRFLLGIGTGHPEHVGTFYRRPYEAMVGYLDALDAEGVPVGDRALAALGPKVLRLAAERSAAAHPYLTTPAHTRQARPSFGTPQDRAHPRPSRHHRTLIGVQGNANDAVALAIRHAPLDLTLDSNEWS
jgi:probable F420-dependent oxidoreductase